MKKRNTAMAVIAALMLMLSFPSFAQMKSPAPSPAASVSQQVGFTNISIDYSSPAVKGRTIFGDLLPWGVTWRAGANAATKITFSTGVKIGDKDLRAGTYSLFITPNKSGDWTIHFNKEGNMVYAYMKDGKIDEEAVAAADAASVSVKAMEVGKAERLHYMISAEDNKTAKVYMHWDTFKVGFDVDTKVDSKMESFNKTFN